MVTLLDKWHLLLRATGDKRLSGRGDLACYIVILDHYNAKKGAAWPSYEAIAQKAALSRSSVAECLIRLKDLGLVSCAPGGKGRSNRYGLIWPTPAESELEHATCSMSESDQSGPPDCDSTVSRTTTVRPTGPDTSYPRVAPSVAGGRGIPSLGGARSWGGAPAGGDPFFASFWKAFPKKEGIKLASIEFANALARGADPELLAAKAGQYAAAKAHVGDPRFLKTPANWLRDDCWLEDPAPPRSKRASDGGQRAATSPPRGAGRPKASKNKSAKPARRPRSKATAISPATAFHIGDHVFTPLNGAGVVIGHTRRGLVEVKTKYRVVKVSPESVRRG